MEGCSEPSVHEPATASPDAPRDHGDGSRDRAEAGERTRDDDGESAPRAGARDQGRGQLEDSGSCDGRPQGSG